MIVDECFFWYRLTRVDPGKGLKMVVCVIEIVKSKALELEQ